MKEITIYIADDGTEFDDEFECMEYEFRIKIAEAIANNSIFFYDENGKPVIDAEKILEGESIFAVKINNPDALLFIKKLNEWNGMFDEINSIGEWEYRFDERDSNGYIINSEGWYYKLAD